MSELNTSDNTVQGNAIDTGMTFKVAPPKAPTEVQLKDVLVACYSGSGKQCVLFIDSDYQYSKSLADQLVAAGLAKRTTSKKQQFGDGREG